MLAVNQVPGSQNIMPIKQRIEVLEGIMGKKISVNVMNKAVSKIREEDNKNELRAVSRFSSYLEEMKAGNDGFSYSLKVSDDNYFERLVAVMPGAKAIFPHLRNIFSMDAAAFKEFRVKYHLKESEESNERMQRILEAFKQGDKIIMEKQVVAIVVGRTVNNNNVLIAFGIGQSEACDLLDALLDEVDKADIQLNNEENTIIYDRGIYIL
jgi:hypothetical protein